MKPTRETHHIEIAAVVVTYHPDADFPARLSQLREQIEHVVIVDNGSGPKQQAMLSSLENLAQITVLKNDKNLGIATALNQGISLLKEKGYAWAVTLDQDSVPAPDMVQNLLDKLQGSPDPGEVALVGPNRIDEGMSGAPHKWIRPKRGFPFFEKVSCEKIGEEGVSIVITSGTLTNLNVFDEVGPFEDAFFIDFVDTEYCLRVRKAGYRILVSCQAKLYHRLGAKRAVKFFGLSLVPTFHKPIRKYYLFRNRIAMIRKYGLVFPHWLIYELAATLHILLCILLCEDEKRDKLMACVQGTWDGLRGQIGERSKPN